LLGLGPAVRDVPDDRPDGAGVRRRYAYGRAGARDGRRAADDAVPSVPEARRVGRGDRLRPTGGREGGGGSCGRDGGACSIAPESPVRASLTLVLCPEARDVAGS